MVNLDGIFSRLPNVVWTSVGPCAVEDFETTRTRLHAARDGVGGATGSSKVQTVESVETAGAEVQKGNAIEERKIQRLFRDGNVTRLIKKSNDFGAGGVCVAIGELADGLEINLDKIPCL